MCMWGSMYRSMRAAKRLSRMWRGGGVERPRVGVGVHLLHCLTRRKLRWKSATSGSVRRFRCSGGKKKKMPSDHQRNTIPMLTSPRCGAKTRSNRPCKSPAVRGKRRCRMHGGAPGSGAPRGNRNALKNGFFTRKALEERRAVQDLLRQSRDLLKMMNDSGR
jgi:hypothetical protein